MVLPTGLPHPAALDELAAELDRTAGRLDEIGSVVLRRVNRLAWSGPAAAAFSLAARGAVASLGAHAAGMRADADRVRRLADELRAELAALERTGVGLLGVASRLTHRLEHDVRRLLPSGPGR